MIQSDHIVIECSNALSIVLLEAMQEIWQGLLFKGIFFFASGIDS